MCTFVINFRVRLGLKLVSVIVLSFGVRVRVCVSQCLKCHLVVVWSGIQMPAAGIFFLVVIIPVVRSSRLTKTNPGCRDFSFFVLIIPAYGRGYTAKIIT